MYSTSTWFIKELLHVVIPIFAEVGNMSFKSDYIPVTQKLAVVQDQRSQADHGFNRSEVISSGDEAKF